VISSERLLDNGSEVFWPASGPCAGTVHFQEFPVSYMSPGPSLSPAVRYFDWVRWMFQWFASSAMDLHWWISPSNPHAFVLFKCHGSSAPFLASAWDVVGGWESPHHRHGDQPAEMALAVVTVKTTCCRRRGDESTNNWFRCRYCWSSILSSSSVTNLSRIGFAVASVEAPRCRRVGDESGQISVSLSPLLKLHVVATSAAQGHTD